jgi:signal transduction histidine kinase
MRGQFRNGGKMTAVSRDQNVALPGESGDRPPEAAPIHEQGHEAMRGMRGLLHDLGHQLMTLSLLAESVRSDEAIPGESRRRIELVKQEMFRAMDMITDHLALEDPSPADASPDPLDIRELAGQAAQLAELAYGATVELLPGRRTTVRMSPAAAWRVLSNLVDNAARSAGPHGHVQISVRQEVDTVIEVLDDGPGIGQAPGGTAGLGLSVVRQLVDAVGGQLEVSDRPGGGARALVIFCPQRECAIVPLRAGSWR